MKRWGTALAVVVMATVFVAATFGTGKEEGTKFALKYSILEVPEHPQGVGVLAFKQSVEKLSGGQITVQPFFSGTLFTQEGAFPAIVAGDLEMTHLATALMAPKVPRLAMFTSTYLFKDYDHMRRAMDSKISTDLIQEVSQKVGVTILGFYYGGARTLNLRTSAPVTKPQDLAGKVLRMPNAPAWIQAGESLGAKVAPMAYSEVYVALQTGAVDAQDNPMAGTKAAKFYEVAKQICLTHHILELGPICVTNKVWERMNAQQKQWMQKAAAEAIKAVDAAYLKSESELVSFFKSQGCIIVEPDINAFKEYSFNYYKSKGITATWDMNLYDQIQKMAR